MWYQSWVKEFLAVLGFAQSMSSRESGATRISCSGRESLSPYDGLRDLHLAACSTSWLLCLVQLTSSGW